MSGARLAILVVSILAAAAGIGVYLSLEQPAKPKALPELHFRDAAGGERKLADFHGRVVLLNIWATWCAPCREEMPALDLLVDRRGREIGRHVGPAKWDAPEMIERLQRRIAEGAPQ